MVVYDFSQAIISDFGSTTDLYPLIFNSVPSLLIVFSFRPSAISGHIISVVGLYVPLWHFSILFQQTFLIAFLFPAWEPIGRVQDDLHYTTTHPHNQGCFFLLKRSLTKPKVDVFISCSRLYVFSVITNTMCLSHLICGYKYRLQTYLENQKCVEISSIHFN